MDLRSDIDLSPDAIETLGARRLADLLLRHAGRDAALREELRLALLAAEPADRLAGELAEAIEAIDADPRDCDGMESGGLAATLDRLRASITADLLPRDPKAAADLLGRLLRLETGVLERCDDSDGLIADVFSSALADCGRAWLAVPGQPPQALAELVFGLFAESDYSVRGDIVPAFKDALGPVGLDALEGLIRHRLGALSDGPTDWREADLVRALTEIADARGDLESYIALHEQAGTEASAVKDICERLVAAGRLEEALDRAQRAEVPGWRRGDIDRLRIDILARLERTAEAQALRRDLFARTLSPTVLDSYLAALPDAERPAALAGAIALAQAHGDIHGALELLVRLDLDAAATLVNRRVQDLNPQLYRVLRPAAATLAAKHPLAASLLFRHLAESVLDQGQTSAYGYAVGDLESAEGLSETVADWLGHPSHDLYRQQLFVRHHQKRAFWERMRQAGLDWR
ncbi:DUF6880 family protein [Azospirillum agricola]|uniref:DUF6880 family protein n=1 Tax=Azospirillum agricola TaxID=1720247 RepID=UPI000A0F3947|nr:DUF6880 family protein [Azospirillum agricola]SMH35970.1 hypothetical protein SAMN02982994_0953 [Azospirillum lipoferum]